MVEVEFVTDDLVPTLLITGTIGSGKTAVLREVGEVLGEVEIGAFAALDIDNVTAKHPRPSDDPFNERLAFANLACVWENFRAAGARRLLLAAVIESRAALVEYRQAVPGADITVVRLTVSESTAAERIRRRELNERSRQWHLLRAVELARILDAARVEDYAVSNDIDRPLLDAARVEATRSATT